MTQLGLELANPVRLPDREKQRQLYELLYELKKRRITLWIAIHELGIGSLSSRICDLKKMGWPVRDRFIVTSGGAHVKEYWLE